MAVLLGQPFEYYYYYYTDFPDVNTDCCFYGLAALQGTRLLINSKSVRKENTHRICAINKQHKTAITFALLAHMEKIECS